jgi:hypothetical protein
MLESNPVRTKLIQAATITSIGNIVGQLASGVKALDFKSTLCYVLATAPPYSHFWYMFLAKSNLPVVIKVAVDQLFWRSFMIFVDFVSYGFWADHSKEQIMHTARTTFVETWKKGIVLWTGVGLFNQSYVPPLYQTVTTDIVGFVWTMYMAGQVAKGGHKDEYDQDPDGFCQ